MLPVGSTLTYQPTEPATMTTILQINSSLHGDDAQSSRLASEFVAALGGSRQRPGSTSPSRSPLIVRDLSKTPVPHLTAERLTALSTATAERTLDQVDGLLKAKLRGSGLEQYVEVVARIDTEAEKRLVPVYHLEIGRPESP